MTPATKRVVFLVLLLVVLSVRLFDLSADPPAWLSWSSGIYSDEGIYAADARSIALFGHWCSGDFHSAEIVPLQNLLLLGIFKIFGVSLISVRTLSLVGSLATLALFFSILRKQFDDQTALIGVVFLGLSPVYLFYNRLGLLETPTTFLLVFALYLQATRRPGWLCGLALALAVAYKPLAILCLPAFFIDYREDRAALLKRGASFVGGMAIYTAVWQWPHRHDLMRINHYYITHQYLPHSASGLAHNVIRSWVTGSADGVVPYLLHHELILIVLALSVAWHKELLKDSRVRCYCLWLLVPIAAFTVISYEPSRYFILFWPALAALAAIIISRMPAKWQMGTVSAFVLVSALTIGTSLFHSTHDVERGGKTLEAKLRPGTTIVGQYAPAFALSNNLPAIYVQPGLANDKTPNDHAAVLITLSPYWSGYWARRLRIGPTTSSLLDLNLPHNQEVIVLTITAVAGTSGLRDEVANRFSKAR
jgi:4-amino-4-deoxy-L-arabinose transferase-like glycosyltransferase